MPHQLLEVLDFSKRGIFIGCQDSFYQCKAIKTRCIQRCTGVDAKVEGLYSEKRNKMYKMFQDVQDEG